MGPRGPLSLKERLRDAQINSDCHRREKALNVLRDEGYAKFALYVISKNVPLHNPGTRIHNVCCKSYLLRDEFYNDCLFVKAILNKNISSASIIQLHEASKEFKRLHILDYSNFNASSYEGVIKVAPIIEDYKGPVGAMGFRGPGDDGYGGSCCGDSPTIRQYINDPICVLMSLFIRSDRSLIDYMLENERKLTSYLHRTFQLFLIDPEAYDELVLISHYMHLTLNTFSYAGSFAKRAYSERYNKGDFSFLQKMPGYCTSEIGIDKVFIVESKYLDILPSTTKYMY